MKKRLLIFLLYYSGICSAQITLEGRVRDAVTKEPVSYCAIGLKHQSQGWLSNEDGIFKIRVASENDTLYVSFVGYKKKMLTVAELAKNPLVELEPKANKLSEVVVYGDDSYLYDLVEKCRKSLFRAKTFHSKVYFVLESHIADQPVELLESYYNGSFSTIALSELLFKNGRVGLAPRNNRYFVNINTSRAISFLDLLNKHAWMPGIPLQLSRRDLKKIYRLKLEGSYDTLNPVYQVSFTPRQEENRYFSGEAWIEKRTGVLKKITLRIYNTRIHPFMPVFKDFGKIEHASMQLTKSYDNSGGENLLQHIDFNYQIRYSHVHSQSLTNENPDTTFEISTRGVMHFYDYGKQFYVPRFEYDQDLDDYHKIASLSYNEDFWNTNHGLAYSDKMKKGIAYFKDKGVLINYKNNLARPAGGDFSQHPFFQKHYLPWSATSRISLVNSGIPYDSTVSRDVSNSMRYRLKAQIFFDVNTFGDSLQHYSTTVFDLAKTYYNLPEEQSTDCFLNIYFDLVEIARQDMEKTMAVKHFNIMQLDSVYMATVKNLETQTAEYCRKVQRGRNLKELAIWSDKVKVGLKIDNVALFKLKITR